MMNNVTFLDIETSIIDIGIELSDMFWMHQTSDRNNNWIVRPKNKKIEKVIENLSKKVKNKVIHFCRDVENSDPWDIAKRWPNYKKTKGKKDCWHCSLKKGHPTYVIYWYVDKDYKIVEVYYVGTHEGAPKSYLKAFKASHRRRNMW